METWIFADWNPLDNRELAAIDYMKPTDVVLGIGGEHKKFSFNCKIDKIKQNIAELANLNVRTHLMVWIRRHRQFVMDMCSSFGNLLQLLHKTGYPITSGLLDAEGPYERGSFNSTLSAQYVDNNLIQPARAINIPIGVTGLARLVSQAVIKLLEVCDYGLPQAYACYKPVIEDHFTHKPTFRPKIIHKISYDSWAPHTVEVGKPMIMGQALYWLKQPGYTELQALRTSHEEAIKYKVQGEAYWSLKHGDELGGNEQDRMDFIREITLTHLEDHASVQWLLKELGYYKADIDGKWGPQSRAAIGDFRTITGISEDALRSFTKQDLMKLIRLYRYQKDGI